MSKKVRHFEVEVFNFRWYLCLAGLNFDWLPQVLSYLLFVASIPEAGWCFFANILLYFFGDSSNDGLLIHQAYMALNDVDAAVESFKKALDLEPNDGQ